MSDFKKQLKGLRFDHRSAPDAVWVRSNRAALMSKIRAEEAVHSNDTVVSSGIDRLFRMFSILSSVFVPQKLITASRYALTLLLVVGISVSSWIGAAAATEGSLPGDALHGLKIATEGVELAVTSAIGSKEKKVEIILKHASTRVEEYSRSTKPKQKKASLDSLKKKIETTNQELKKIDKSSSSEDAVKVAKVVEQETEKILEKLEEAAIDKTKAKKQGEQPVISTSTEDQGSGSPVITDKMTAEKEESTARNTEEEVKDTVSDEESEVLRAVAEAEAILEDTGIDAVEVLVEESQKEIAGISAEEVKIVIVKKLDRLTKDVKALEATLEAMTVTASNTEKINRTTREDTVSVTPLVTSSTTVDSSKQDDGILVNPGTEGEQKKGLVTSAVYDVVTTGNQVLGGAEVRQVFDTTDLNTMLETIQSLKEVKEKITENVIESKKDTKHVLEKVIQVEEIVKKATEEQKRVSSSPATDMASTTEQQSSPAPTDMTSGTLAIPSDHPTVTTATPKLPETPVGTD